MKSVYSLLCFTLFLLITSCGKKEEPVPTNPNYGPLLKEVSMFDGSKFIYEYNASNHIKKISFIKGAKVRFYNTISYDGDNRVKEIALFDSTDHQGVIFTPLYNTNGRFIALSQFHKTFGIFRIDSLFYNSKEEVVKIQSYAKNSNTFVLDNEYIFTVVNKNVESWQFFTMGVDSVYENAMKEYEYDNKINPFSRINFVATMSFLNSFDPDVNHSELLSANNLVKSTSRNGEVEEQIYMYNEAGLPTKGLYKDTVRIEFLYK